MQRGADAAQEKPPARVCEHHTSCSKAAAPQPLLSAVPAELQYLFLLCKGRTSELNRWDVWAAALGSLIDLAECGDTATLVLLPRQGLSSAKTRAWMAPNLLSL